MTTKHVRRAAFISSYTPRKCGIATFTSDLIANIKLASEGEFELDDQGTTVTKNEQVSSELAQACRKAAEECPSRAIKIGE